MNIIKKLETAIWQNQHKIVEKLTRVAKARHVINFQTDVHFLNTAVSSGNGDMVKFFAKLFDYNNPHVKVLYNVACQDQSTYMTLLHSHGAQLELYVEELVDVCLETGSINVLAKLVNTFGVDMTDRHYRIALENAVYYTSTLQFVIENLSSFDFVEYVLSLPMLEIVIGNRNLELLQKHTYFNVFSYHISNYAYAQLEKKLFAWINADPKFLRLILDLFTHEDLTTESLWKHAIKNNLKHEFLDVFIKDLFSPSAYDNFGLHESIAHNRVDTVKYLFKYGAKLPQHIYNDSILDTKTSPEMKKVLKLEYDTNDEYAKPVRY